MLPATRVSTGLERETGRIRTLTPDEQAAFEQHRERWQLLATSVRPTNRPVAEAALLALCANAGLQSPRIVWCGSPSEMFLRLNTLVGGKNVWHSVGGLLGDRVWRTLWEFVHEDLGHRVWRDLSDTYWHSFIRNCETIYEELPEPRSPNTVGAVEWADRTEVLACHRVELVSGRTGEIYTHESWVSELLPTLSFFNEVLGIEALHEVGPLSRLAESAGPWVAREQVAYVSERPTSFALDEQGRLHCEDGPALAYPKGKPLYAWHGVRVPAAVILTPERITTKTIRRERNVEVRRVMVERFGLERFFASGHAVLRDESSYGKLWGSTPRKEFRASQWLELQNSTPEPDGSHKTYILEVPPWFSTAHEAVAWTFGMTDDEYVVAAES